MNLSEGHEEKKQIFLQFSAKQQQKVAKSDNLSFHTMRDRYVIIHHNPVSGGVEALSQGEKFKVNYHDRRSYFLPWIVKRLIDAILMLKL